MKIRPLAIMFFAGGAVVGAAAMSLSNKPDGRAVGVAGSTAEAAPDVSIRTNALEVREEAVRIYDEYIRLRTNTLDEARRRKIEIHQEIDVTEKQGKAIKEQLKIVDDSLKSLPGAASASAGTRIRTALKTLQSVMVGFKNAEDTKSSAIEAVLASKSTSLDREYRDVEVTIKRASLDLEAARKIREALWNSIETDRAKIDARQLARERATFDPISRRGGIVLPPSIREQVSARVNSSAQQPTASLGGTTSSPLTKVLAEVSFAASHKGEGGKAGDRNGGEGFVGGKNGGGTGSNSSGAGGTSGGESGSGNAESGEARLEMRDRNTHETRSVGEMRTDGVGEIKADRPL